MTHEDRLLRSILYSHGRFSLNADGTNTPLRVLHPPGDSTDRARHWNFTKPRGFSSGGDGLMFDGQRLLVVEAKVEGGGVDGDKASLDAEKRREAFWEAWGYANQLRALLAAPDPLVYVSSNADEAVRLKDLLGVSAPDLRNIEVIPTLLSIRESARRTPTLKLRDLAERACAPGPVPVGRMLRRRWLTRLESPVPNDRFRWAYLDGASPTDDDHTFSIARPSTADSRT